MFAELRLHSKKQFLSPQPFPLPVQPTRDSRIPRLIGRHVRGNVVPMKPTSIEGLSGWLVRGQVVPLTNTDISRLIERLEVFRW